MGEGIAVCELLKWFVKEGDEVEEFQPLCEVQSDKATIEITSRYKEKVSQILYVPGNIVKVGETLLKIDVEVCAISTVSPSNGEKIKLPSDNTKLPDSELNKNTRGGISSTPAVRHLARQYGIDLNDVQGSGKDGRILREDVLKYAIEKGIVESSSTDSSGGDKL